MSKIVFFVDIVPMLLEQVKFLQGQLANEQKALESATEDIKSVKTLLQTLLAKMESIERSAGMRYFPIH